MVMIDAEIKYKTHAACRVRFFVRRYLTSGRHNSLWTYMPAFGIPEA